MAATIKECRFSHPRQILPIAYHQSIVTYSSRNPPRYLGLILVAAAVGVFGLLHAGVARAQVINSPTVHHYLYAASGNGPVTLYIYDIDDGFSFVNQMTLNVPTQTYETRGMVASAATGMLYISYGCFADPRNTAYCCDGLGGYLIKYNLLTNQMVWVKNYPFGVDSFSITPDGQKIYMPVGENSASTLWEIIDAATGDVLGSIDSGEPGPHNTIVSNSGARVYLGPTDNSSPSHGSPYLVAVNTADNSIIQRIGPVSGSSVRPFTIDSRERWAFINVLTLLGFQVGDIATGKILYTVPAAGFSSGWSHGLTLSPDDREIYVADAPNNYVHVFDVSGLPSLAPRQVADIPVTPTYNAHWLLHSRDGRFVFVGGGGDVINTATRQVVGNIPNIGDKFTEVDFQNGAVYFAPLSPAELATQPALRRHHHLHH
jgi:DNA-binding beta-propeller fold protein YncE